MIVKNKWNGKLYTVLSIGSKVKLQRQDGSVFEIEVKEYKSNYREIKNAGE